ncbi:MAG: hypothetical protein GVX90_00290 [Alphaproteobacteria bacterium]|nr:hypothetical protein [Alphaproteobacteria bacterium]
MRNPFPVRFVTAVGGSVARSSRALRPIGGVLSSAARRLPAILLGLAAPLALHAPLAAQDDAAVTQAGDGNERGADERGEGERTGDEGGETRARRSPIDIMITVPRGEVNEAAMRECEDEADASTISGDIVVCRRRATSGEERFSSGDAAERRYAEETAFKDAPRAPDMFGIADNGKGISIGGTPPPPLIIDVGALPEAPAGSDADRIARGLPPLGQDEELSEEEIRERREALGLPPPKFEKKPR